MSLSSIPAEDAITRRNQWSGAPYSGNSSSMSQRNSTQNRLDPNDETALSTGKPGNDTAFGRTGRPEGRGQEADTVDDSMLSFMEIPHGSGCAHCAASMGGLPSFQRTPDGRITRNSLDSVVSAQKAQFGAIDSNTRSHEAMHAAYTGGTISYNMQTVSLANGETMQIANGGATHFDPSPAFAGGNDPTALRSAAQQAMRFKAGAEAPGSDMSGQDHAVSAQMASLYAQNMAKANQIEANPVKFGLKGDKAVAALEKAGKSVGEVARQNPEFAQSLSQGKQQQLGLIPRGPQSPNPVNPFA
ncbi:MAG: hypothetical protein KC475_01820 [Cyanobacteria bacterium HKST-UBA03]|nr:hypothetical protein [Cyanobacteria bacterium HKST-UBA03]